MPLLTRVLCVLALCYYGPAFAFAQTERPNFTSVPTLAAQEARQVWVNSRSGVYHCPGSRYYGTTKAGQLMTEAAARAKGNRPAHGNSCGGERAAVQVNSPPRLGTASRSKEEVQGSRVWVNNRSAVYHCPGTRYYGNTTSGQFMTEAQAKAAGNRPAYGRNCG